MLNRTTHLLLLSLGVIFAVFDVNAQQKTDTVATHSRLFLDSISSGKFLRFHPSTNTLNRKTDSLRAVIRPPMPLTEKFDSLHQALQALTSFLSPKSISTGLTKELTRANFRADSSWRNLRSKIPLHPLQGSLGKTDSLLSRWRPAGFPATGRFGPATPWLSEENKILNGISLPSLSRSPATGAISNPLSTVEQEASGLVSKKSAVGDITKLQSLVTAKMSPELSRPVSELKTDEPMGMSYVKKVRNFKLDSALVEKAGKKAESETVNRSEMGDFKTETAKVQSAQNSLQQYQTLLSKMNSQEGSSASTVLVNREMVDPFAEKEAKLKIGISQLDKLKRKYGNIPDSRYLPRRAPNELKGKPFKERFIPGVNFQLFKNDYSVIDLSPFALYRLTTRIRSGLGWAYRLNIDDHQKRLVHERRADGFRAMTDFRLIPNLWVHGEYELMNFAPYNPLTQNKTDPSLPRKWLPGLYVGMLKTYKISRLINGNFQALYNLKYEKNGLYPSKINLRFGFEFNLNKKKLMFVPAGPAVEK